jgi:hypothetical protein
MPEPPPPAHFANPDTLLRLRFYVGGTLRDELWVDAADAASSALTQTTAAYHATQAQMADAADVPWLVEVYDPAADEAEAYLRFGTDVAGMTAPLPVPSLRQRRHRGQDEREEPGQHESRRSHG